MNDALSDQEKQILLQLARRAIEHGVRGKKLPGLKKEDLTPVLLAPGASFVTLTIGDMLRGCIGTLDAYQSLAEDVREHAVAAALQDPRFAPVQEGELDGIHIEVSRLTAPHLLEYSSSDELLEKLRPHVDGVLLRQGHRRATFLPQVWEKIPDPVEFMNALCEKMGVRSGAWRDTKLQVYTYQVEEFHELN
jgi:AmmeMemoRadiSam system protein A